MFSPIPNIESISAGFSLERNFRFSQFSPRLFNYVTKKAGMEPGLIMPARCFCSDGSQGYPTMLLAKHFGTFPFDYGQIGGTFDFNRSPAFVTHGRDMVVVQATHVGYDPVTKKYGEYPRHRTSTDPANVTCTANCGLVKILTKPYSDAYSTAASQTLVAKNRATGEYQIRLLDLFLSKENASRFPVTVEFDIPRMLRLSGTGNDAIAKYVSKDPVSRTFVASDEFARHLSQYKQFADESSVEDGKFVPLGDALTPAWFKFPRADAKAEMGQYEKNLRDQMEWIVTQPAPLLAAAQVCAQSEFQRFLTEVYFAKSWFENRNLFYICGIMIDVAPSADQLGSGCAFYPRSLFVPWAAYSQRFEKVEVEVLPSGATQVKTSGKFIKETWDQDRIFRELEAVDATNDKAMLLDKEIERLVGLPPIKL
jgi:hypothetical protein